MYPWGNTQNTLMLNDANVVPAPMREEVNETGQPIERGPTLKPM